MPNYFKSHTIKEKKRNRDAEFIKQILDKLDFDYASGSFISTRGGGSRFETSRIVSNSVTNSPKRIDAALSRSDQRKNQTSLMETQRSYSYEPHTQRQIKESDNIKIKDESAFELKPIQVSSKQPRHNSVAQKASCKKHPPTVYIPNKYRNHLDASDFSPRDEITQNSQTTKTQEHSPINLNNVTQMKQQQESDKFKISKMFPSGGNQEMYPKMFEASRNFKELASIQTGPNAKGSMTMNSDYVQGNGQTDRTKKQCKTSYKQYRRSSMGDSEINDNSKVLKRIRTREKNMSLAYGMPIVSSCKTGSPDSLSMTKQVQMSLAKPVLECVRPISQGQPTNLRALQKINENRNKDSNPAELEGIKDAVLKLQLKKRSKSQQRAGRIDFTKIRNIQSQQRSAQEEMSPIYKQESMTMVNTESRQQERRKVESIRDNSYSDYNRNIICKTQISKSRPQNQFIQRHASPQKFMSGTIRTRLLPKAQE